MPASLKRGRLVEKVRKSQQIVEPDSAEPRFGNLWPYLFRVKRKRGRPSRGNDDTEKQARKEFEFKQKNPHKTWAEVRDALYPQLAVEVNAIKQRVRRYAQKRNLRLK